MDTAQRVDTTGIRYQAQGRRLAKHNAGEYLAPLRITDK
jgi:hypothetical protein